MIHCILFSINSYSVLTVYDLFDFAWDNIFFTFSTNLFALTSYASVFLMGKIIYIDYFLSSPYNIYILSSYISEIPWNPVTKNLIATVINVELFNKILR